MKRAESALLQLLLTQKVESRHVEDKMFAEPAGKLTKLIMLHYKE